MGEVLRSGAARHIRLPNPTGRLAQDDTGRACRGWVRPVADDHGRPLRWTCCHAADRTRRAAGVLTTGAMVPSILHPGGARLRGASDILIRGIAALCCLAMVPVGSGVCHKHMHDLDDTHHDHEAGHGHFGLCEHHRGQDVSASPYGMPEPKREPGSCCSGARSTFALRQAADARSGYASAGPLVLVEASTRPPRAPFIAVRGNATGPPAQTIPLSQSQRLRI
jgi:hypothetical protein